MHKLNGRAYARPIFMHKIPEVEWNNIDFFDEG